MADCGDSPYQAIEYRGLFDLKDAQIIRAEIDSIDAGANTAAVTLLDACDQDDWLDTAEVPFFYHCENSTGTVEDLALGHMAFAVGDMVYILLNKATDTVAEQAYIIGHVDIRSTRRCLDPEYLVVILALTYKGTPYSFFTIFDASTGSKMDIAEFENLAGSPAKPASLPIATASGASWLSFNFEAAGPSYPFSGSITLTNRTSWFGWWDSVTSDSETVLYTGDSHNLCTIFSTGNGTYVYNTSQTYTGNNSAGHPVDYSEEYTDENIGVTKYELGDSYCRGYWGSTSSGTTLSHQGDKVQIGSITSLGSHALWYFVDRAFERSASVVNSGDTVEIDSSNYSYSCSFALRDNVSCSTLSGFRLEQNLTWSGSVTGTLSLPPNFDSIIREVSRTTDYSSTSSLNAFPDYSVDSITNGEVYRLCPWLTTMSNASNCFIVGYYYVYGLIGAISAEQWINISGHHITQYGGLGVYPDVWPAYIEGKPNVPGGSVFIKVVPRSATVVADVFADVAPVSPDTDIHMYDCIQESNTAKAAGLDAVINELFDFMVNTCNPTNITDSQTLISAIRQGPSAIARKKKEV